VACADLSREPLDPEAVSRAQLIGVYLPMHTATRLALPVLARVRAANPSARLCAFGLYARLNDDLLKASGVHDVFGPEFESDLVDLALAVLDGGGGPRARDEARASGGVKAPGDRSPAVLPKLDFLPPDRTGLLPPSRYSRVLMPDGTRRIAGSTDATRGCKHRCRHCPIVPIYDGQFRVVPVDVVLADARAQVAEGADHITFGDPDFFNGPAHARRIVEALHREWPALTYDVTIKVEHLLRHRAVLPLLVGTGCAFVTSAVESMDDDVLRKLEKGHTRADFEAVVALCREVGLALAPTFVAFTPWTTLDGYRGLLETIARLDLVGHVSPVQWGIRLLVTGRSRLLELPEIQRAIGPFNARTLTYPWRHADPRVDALQESVMRLVGVRAARSRYETFDAIVRLAKDIGGDVGAGDTPDSEAAGDWPVAATPRRSRAAIPYLDEPWYC
jgi:radical SAM superfamily enzyme YgiQ (UPF0313 family)